MSLVLPSMHGLILTLIFLGVSSAVLFAYVPVPSSYRTKKRLNSPTTYFILFFLSVAVAFLIYSFHPIIPEWAAIFFTHALYILSVYFLIIGLRRRQGKAAPPRYIILGHLLVIAIVSVGYLSVYTKNPFLRTLFLSVNLVGLLWYSLFCITKADATFIRGETVLRVIIYICIALACIAPIMYIVSGTLETFLSYTVVIQSLQMHIIFGGLCVLMLSDVIDLHYKNSVTDAMTGMYNRRYFMQKSDALLSRCHEQKLSPTGALIICDIDNFKQVNDNYGHDTGDKVIIQFGRMLRKLVREHDILARIGGEEFAIFLPNTSLETAQKIAERMRECTEVMKLTSRTDGEIHYTASFGVASLNEATKVSTLMRAADSAMYCAKDAGRNRVHVFQGDTQQAKTLPNFTSV